MRTADYYNVSFLVSGESAGPALAVFGEMSGKISYYARVSQRERGENGIFVFIYYYDYDGAIIRDSIAVFRQTHASNALSDY